MPVKAEIFTDRKIIHKDLLRPCELVPGEAYMQHSITNNDGSRQVLFEPNPPKGFPRLQGHRDITVEINQIL